MAKTRTRTFKGSQLKEKAVEELKRYWVIALYLTVMLAAFTSYRRLVLAGAGVSYLHYGVAVIEALVLAKVILIGEALGLAKRHENDPLMMSVLFKAVVFGVFAGLLGMLEHAIEGLMHRETWNAIGHRLISGGRNELLARTVMLIVTFIPFFAFWETDRALGEGKLLALFFRKRSVSSIGVQS